MHDFLSRFHIQLSFLLRAMSNLALFAAMFLTLCSDAHSRSCSYQKIPGAMKESLRISSFTAESEIDCVMTSCGCDSFCAVSFHPSSKLCWKTLFAAILDLSQFVMVADSDPWITYLLSGPVDPPSGLWPFDDIAKGRNLGKKGSQLDYTVSGLVWNWVGPRGDTERKYPTYIGPGYPIMQILHGSSYALDFSKQFIISVWVKTKDVAENG